MQKRKFHYVYNTAVKEEWDQQESSTGSGLSATKPEDLSLSLGLPGGRRELISANLHMCSLLYQHIVSSLNKWTSKYIAIGMSLTNILEKVMFKLYHYVDFKAK